MTLKDQIIWLRDQVRNYNAFIPNEDDYDDDNGELQDPAITVKHQKYATRVYIPLLISK